MVIREMQAQDVEAVTALEAACFTQPWKRHDFEDILTNPDRFYFVAVEDNEVMGGCMLTDIVGEGDVSNVAVHEKYRRRHCPCFAGIYASIWQEAGNPGLYAGSTPTECGSTGII